MCRFLTVELWLRIFFHSLCLLESKLIAFCARGMPRGAYF
jgi:hypothetical protein